MIQINLKLLLVLLLVQFSEKTFSQQSILLNVGTTQENIESKKYKSVLTKLHLYDSLQQKDSLNFYIQKARELCNIIDVSEKKDKSLIKTGAELYSFIAYNSFKNNQLSDAIIEFRRAEQLYSFLKDKKELATCINNIAVIYFNTGNRVDALKNFQRTNKIFIDLKDSVGIATTHYNLAKIYRQQDDFHQTQKSLDKAMLIASALKNNQLLSRILNSKAGLKKEIGNIDESLALYQEALSLSKANNNDIGVARILNNIGVIYLEKEEYEKAKDFYDRSYKLVKEKKYLLGEAFSLTSLGKYYFVTDQPSKAIELSNEALKIAENINNEEVKLKAILLLLEIYEKQKDWEQAFKYQNLLIQQNNKSEKTTIEQISQQQSIRLKLEKDKFNSRKQEVEHVLATEKKNQKENIFYIVSIVVFVLLITTLFIIYFRLRASRERNKYITKQSEERKLLLQEVHHRVKNNFQIVSSMLRLQSYNFDNEELRLNFEEAVNRINAMAIVHDVIYRQEKFKDINSKTYLEKLIFSLSKTGDNRIVIKIDSEEIPFKIETLINIGIALNELITNSFKHAFNHKIDNPEIFISLHTIGEKTYELYYKDNGVGISKESYSTNFGMDLIETIIDNYEGEVQIINDEVWNTSIRVTFKEF